MKHVDLYTDGACSYNPGPGGWGCVLIYGKNQKQISGGVNSTTNNRMEIFAVIQGLRALKTACEVTVYSDSAYVVNAINQGWLENWQKNNWKNASKDPVKNTDLWKLLLMEMSDHKCNFVKVKGHADNEYNNLCDKLATTEIKKLIEVYGLPTTPVVVSKESDEI